MTEYEREEKPHIALIGICLFMCCGAIITEWGMIKGFWREREISSWPTTPGVVRKSEVGDCAGGFEAKVTYEYEVGGQQSTSSNISPNGAKFLNESDAKSLARRFPVNADVLVSYNPVKPAESYLINLTWKSYALIVAPILATLVFGLASVTLIWLRWTFDRRQLQARPIS